MQSRVQYTSTDPLDLSVGRSARQRHRVEINDDPQKGAASETRHSRETCVSFTQTDVTTTDSFKCIACFVAVRLNSLRPPTTYTMPP